MVLALGSALTFVFFLLFGRVFWSVAMQAGARRCAKDVPVAMLELQADRDRLRAEHALMARKLELRLDDIKIRMAEQMAEVSRNRNRVQSLLQDADSKSATLKIRDREIASMQSALDAAKTDLEASRQTIENLTAEAERHDSQMAQMQDAFRKVGVSLREKNAVVGNLNDELKSVINRGAGAPVAKVDAGDHLRQRVAELTSISVDMERDHKRDAASESKAPAPVEPFQDATSRLQEKLEATTLQSEQMEADLRALDELLATRTSETAISQSAGEKKSGGKANVISIAQRIRALQQGMNE